MDVDVIATYRCNSRCAMCNVWRYPSLPDDEVSLDTMDRLPFGIDHLGLTGGEPTLRRDLQEIVDLMYPKAMVLEISSNGLHAERLEPIVRKYPNIKIRFSLDGQELTNNRIRGEQGGYQKKVRGLLRLKELGATDLGFAVTIQDDNAAELVDLFSFAQHCRVELATSALHNGFQFHKNDNYPYDRLRVARHIQELVVAQLKTSNVKNWFRAYMSLGLIAKVLGHNRLLTCSAGSNFVFVDPWSDVYACNVRPDLRLGNLKAQQWQEIIDGPDAHVVRQKVASCNQSCWMVGSAKIAMRHPRFTRMPTIGPLAWVVENKLRVALGLQVQFSRYIDYSAVQVDGVIPPRISNLDRTVQRRVQSASDRLYDSVGEFVNR